ncbi:putative calcium-binding protein CML10 [Cucumis melo var. makuwa]|uniref:Calcium-binding protein CML10 n=2 Tax=Cucumis melo TaxID=3656 RepID=A0A5A7V4S6_CUCMM|nr:putative calcium-binding protein CML10 [Cucumis melo var. makuwa]
MAMSRSQLKLTRDEVREILEEHDVDGDGNLTKQEVMQALNSMGALMSFQKAHYGVSHADKDGDGKVDLTREDELEKLVDYVMRFQTPRTPKVPKVPAQKPCHDGKSIV